MQGNMLQVFPLEGYLLKVSCGDAVIQVNLKEHLDKEYRAGYAAGLVAGAGPDPSPPPAVGGPSSPGFKFPPDLSGITGNRVASIRGLIDQILETSGVEPVRNLRICTFASWPRVRGSAVELEEGPNVVPIESGGDHLVLVMDPSKTLDLHEIHNSLAGLSPESQVTIALASRQ
jgi:hypothetical protein